MKFVKENIYCHIYHFRSALFFSRLVVLQSVQSEYEHILSLKNELERQVEEYTNELIKTKTVLHSLTNQFKEKIEQMSSEKVKQNFE